MTGFSRPASPSDAIQGVSPDVVYEPSTVEEAVEVLRESSREGKALAFVGGGTDLELGAPPARLDAVVKTGRLARVVEYAPSDQIVAVEAGMTLSQLQRTVASNGQRLALDPPQADRATLGGIVASNAFGPRRARFGSVRDLIIGVSFVRADGTLARGGGKVVKNVAGFDLPKLMVGSLGTLGLVATATFRLHPLPEEESTVLASGITARGVRALVAGIRKAQLEPTSVVAVWRGAGRFDLAVRFEGFRAGVAEQRESLTEIVRGEADGACEILDLSAAKDFWERHDRMRTSGALRAKVAAPPAGIEQIAAEVLPSLLASCDSPAFLWYATLGVGFFCGEPKDATSAAAAVNAARTRLGDLGRGTLTLTAAPAPVREKADVWGPPPSAIALMKSVKDRLDPQRRLAPGRFVGGI